MLEGTGVADSKANRGGLDDLTRFIEHFPLRTQDVSLIVLKGHLLTEELLREFLYDKVRHPSSIRDARLHYIQCIHLARALSDDPDAWVWDALNCLNGIRNKLSHALEPEGLNDTVNSFVQFVRRYNSYEVPEELRELFTPLGFALFSVHTSLSAQLRVKPTSVKPASLLG
jgi:hypothetical protein